MPIRGPVDDRRRALAGAGIRIGPVEQDVRVRSSSIPSAWVSLPGPLESSSALHPRRRAHDLEPASGSSARISTAAPTPSGSQTAFSSAWMP